MTKVVAWQATVGAPEASRWALRSLWAHTPPKANSGLGREAKGLCLEGPDAELAWASWASCLRDRAGWGWAASCFLGFGLGVLSFASALDALDALAGLAPSTLGFFVGFDRASRHDPICSLWAAFVTFCVFLCETWACAAASFWFTESKKMASSRIAARVRKEVKGRFPIWVLTGTSQCGSGTFLCFSSSSSVEPAPSSRSGPNFDWRFFLIATGWGCGSGAAKPTGALQATRSALPSSSRFGRSPSRSI